MQRRLRELALFDLDIDSKLRACDLVKLRARDVCHGDRVAARAIVLQQRTQRPVQFEISPLTPEAVEAWTKHAGLKSGDCLFRSRVHASPHLGTGIVQISFQFPEIAARQAFSAPERHAHEVANACGAHGTLRRSTRRGGPCHHSQVEVGPIIMK